MDDESLEPDVVITVRDDGPYKVTGRFRLIDADGNEFAFEEGQPVALCRCGRSTTKPFCDASHRDAGFASCPRARTGASASGRTRPE